MTADFSGARNFPARTKRHEGLGWNLEKPRRFNGRQHLVCIKIDQRSHVLLLRPDRVRYWDHVAKIVFKRGQRKVDETVVLAWAKTSHARLRRLLARVEKTEGEDRLDALRQLDELRRKTFWRREQDPTVRAERVSAQQANQLRRMYKAVLPVAQRAKRWFVPFLESGSSLDRDDVVAYLEKDPKAVKVGTALSFDWSRTTIGELCSNTPSNWLIARFADKLGYSDQTVKDLLHRKPRHDLRMRSKST